MHAHFFHFLCFSLKLYHATHLPLVTADTGARPQPAAAAAAARLAAAAAVTAAAIQPQHQPQRLCFASATQQLGKPGSPDQLEAAGCIGLCAVLF